MNILTNLILAIFRGRKKKVFLLIGIIIGIYIGICMPKKQQKNINKQTTKIVETFQQKINKIQK